MHKGTCWPGWGCRGCEAGCGGGSSLCGAGPGSPPSAIFHICILASTSYTTIPFYLYHDQLNIQLNCHLFVYRQESATSEENM